MAKVLPAPRDGASRGITGFAAGLLRPARPGRAAAPVFQTAGSDAFFRKLAGGAPQEALKTLLK